MANKSSAHAGGAGERLARESWRLSRMPIADRRRTERCLERRAQALDEIVKRIGEGQAGESDLEALARCLEAGNALLEVWRESRAALLKELAIRRTETQFLRTGAAEQGTGGRHTPCG